MKTVCEKFLPFPMLETPNLGVLRNDIHPLNRNSNEHSIYLFIETLIIKDWISSMNIRKRIKRLCLSFRILQKNIAQIQFVASSQHTDAAYNICHSCVIYKLLSQDFRDKCEQLVQGQKVLGSVPSSFFSSCIELV